MKTVLATCLLLGLAVYQAEALKCYACGYTIFSADDATATDYVNAVNAQMAAVNSLECKDSGDDYVPTSAMEMTCSASQDQCTKNYIKMSGTVSVNGATLPVTMESWTRGCQNSEDGDGNVGCTTDFDEILGYMQASGSVAVTDPTGETEVCACWDKDYCNGAPFLLASLSLLATVLGLHLFA